MNVHRVALLNENRHKGIKSKIKNSRNKNSKLFFRDLINFSNTLVLYKQNELDDRRIMYIFQRNPGINKKK